MDCCVQTYYLLCKKSALDLSIRNAQVTVIIFELTISCFSGLLESLNLSDNLFHLGKTLLTVKTNTVARFPFVLRISTSGQ